MSYDVKLPTTATERKALPLFSGVLNYFPDALIAVAECSKKGNDQHNPGKPLHWDRSKSTDHADCIVRHLIDHGTFDTDGVRHATKVAWRALALLQVEIENERAAAKQGNSIERVKSVNIIQVGEGSLTQEEIEQFWVGKLQEGNNF